MGHPCALGNPLSGAAGREVVPLRRGTGLLEGAVRNHTRRQEQAVQAELQWLQAAASNHTQCLRLVETLADFRDRLRARADTLEVTDRQKILRLLVKEVLVGKDTITIRHSIRIPNSGPDPTRPSGTRRLPGAPQPRPTPHPGPHYLLRSGRHLAPAGEYLPALRPSTSGCTDGGRSPRSGT
jgi:site-specific DNA recombinase